MAVYKSLDEEEDTSVPTDIRTDVKKALAAITKVIENTVRSDRPDRFAEVERLSKVAQQLCRAVATRVSDFADDSMTDALNLTTHNQMVTYGEGELRRDRRGRLVNEVHVFPNDTGEVRRQLLETEGVRNQMEAELYMAQVRAAKATELTRLSEMPWNIRIQRRIDILMAEIAEDTEGDEDEVVHPELPRRHQPGGEGQGNGAASREPDSGRGAGTQAAQGQGTS